MALTLGFLGVDLDVQQAFLLPPVPSDEFIYIEMPKESSAARVNNAHLHRVGRPR